MARRRVLSKKRLVEDLLGKNLYRTDRRRRGLARLLMLGRELHFVDSFWYDGSIDIVEWMTPRRVSDGDGILSRMHSKTAWQIDLVVSLALNQATMRIELRQEFRRHQTPPWRDDAILLT